MALAVDAKAINLQVLSRSYRRLLLGKFHSLGLNIGRARRILRFSSLHVSGEDLNLGFKPLLVVLMPFLLFLSPRLFFPLMLVLMWVPGRMNDADGSSNGTLQQRTRFALSISPDDMNECGIWRWALAGALKDIVEYSIAGLVALPVEVSGQLSTATSFSLQAVNISGSFLVMDGTAHLPDNASFSFTLRTGVSLVEVEGSNCIFWEDPSIRVAPMWPLPEMWAPIGGFCGRRVPSWLNLQRISFPENGDITFEGSFSKSRPGPRPSMPKSMPSLTA